MSQPVWQEDDAAPDAERLAEACLRITGRPLTDFMLHGTKVDLGDAISYALDGWLAVSSYPGNSAIYRSRTRGGAILSPLLAEWHDFARATAEASPTDNFFAVESRDPRVRFPRMVCVGGVSDGRPEKRGVLIVAVTSDGECQELGVSAREQASAVLDALLDAWPDLLEGR